MLRSCHLWRLKLTLASAMGPCSRASSGLMAWDLPSGSVVNMLCSRAAREQGPSLRSRTGQLSVAALAPEKPELHNARVPSEVALASLKTTNRARCQWTMPSARTCSHSPILRCIKIIHRLRERQASISSGRVARPSRDSATSPAETCSSRRVVATCAVPLALSAQETRQTELSM